MVDVKKDQMTPKERNKAFREGKPYDRIPCGLGIGDHASKLIGAKVAEIHLDRDKMVLAQLKAQEVYGTESVGVGPGLGGIAEALGSVQTYPDASTPYISEYAIKELSDLDKLSVVNPHKSKRLSLILEAAGILSEKLSDTLPVSVGVPGPFTTAGNVRGAEKFMRDLYYHPEFAHRLLRLSTDSIIAFVKATESLDVSVGIAEPTASGTLISSKQFKEFVYPYLKELVDAIKSVGKSAPNLHICGNTRRIWGDMADTGAGILSLDDVIDLEEAKHRVGDRVTLTGNVKPTAVMYLGTPEDVEENVKDCLRKAYDTPKGYILSLGCGLPYNTPPENILALFQAARKYGQYPLNPENFSPSTTV